MIRAAARALLLLPAAGILLGARVASAEGPVVTVGRPLDITAPVAGRVLSVGGDLRIRSRVEGDVVSWGGDVGISGAGSVTGDLIVFGGSVSGAEGKVAGRILTPGSLAAIYLAEARQLPWRHAPGSRSATLVGIRLFVLALWLAASTLVLWLFGSPVARAAVCLEESPGNAAAAGILTIALLFLLAVTALAELSGAAAETAAILIAALAMGLKIFGMTGFFLFLGQKLTRRHAPRARPAAMALGLLAAGALSLVPVAGPILWSAASIFAVGAAAFTRFGSPRFRVAVV